MPSSLALLCSLWSSSIRAVDPCGRVTVETTQTKKQNWPQSHKPGWACQHILCANITALDIRRGGGRKSHLGGDQNTSRRQEHGNARLQQGFGFWENRGCCRDEGSSIQPWQKQARKQCLVRGRRQDRQQWGLLQKRLGAADLQEAAGGEITAALWQRADIHQN